MEFSESERQSLLEVKGVGPTVVKRFEEIGICTLSELSKYQVEDVVNLVASMLNTTCWKNSPQAKNAVKAAIECAKRECK